MIDTAKSWSGKIVHITDNPEDQEIQTRCGRTLKNFQLGYPAGETCTKCGSQDDYDAVWEAKRLAHAESEAKRKIQDANRQAIADKRLETHRAIMHELLALLIDVGAEDAEMYQRPAGGDITFKKEGLKFRLSGHIF